MTRPSKRIGILAGGAIACAALLAGCMAGPGIRGTFDRSFNVNGPVQLEVTTGSGDVHVTPGSAGAVRIHGVIHARGWSDEDARRKLNDVESNPPISQDNNLIRVGAPGFSMGDVSIDYTITVPANTELHSRAGSGDVDASGIQGPANFVAGSGNISATGIGNDVQAVAGSGDVKIAGVQGQTQVATGSGDVSVFDAKGAVRLHSGSGDIEVRQPNDAVVAATGSGDVTIDGARADLRVRTGSGTVSISGNPGASNYWDIHASSGDVKLRIPSDASFHLYAHSSSGDIETQVPIVMEGTAGKHELRARIGDGKARVEIETSSGSIALQ
jgi:Putative adhesin